MANQEIIEPADKYWATLPNDQLVKHLVDKRKKFARAMFDSGILNRIGRNWKYYHGLYFNEESGTDMSIKKAEEDSWSLANVNHFRSLVDQYLVYVTSNKVAWDTRAVQNDFEAREQAKLFNDILDAYMEIGGVEDDLKRSAKYAMLLSEGFGYVEWDQGKGAMVRPDVGPDGMPTAEKAFWEGDFNVCTPSIFDVAWDITILDFEDVPYVQVKTFKNRWDLIALYPELEEKLRKVEKATKIARDYDAFGDYGLIGDETDQVEVWNFWHKPCPALPQGRYLMYVGDEIPLSPENAPNEYGILPIARLIPSEYVLTCMGYTNAFDMQVPQEWYGAMLSSMLSDLNTLGQPKIFIHSDSEVAPEELEPGSGVPVLRGRIKPEVIDFKSEVKDLSEGMQLPKTEQELMAGIGPVSRGQPTGGLKEASGAAFALLDSKSYQSTSDFGARFRAFAAKIGTILLKVGQKKATTKRMAALAGKANHGKLIRWSADDLTTLDRVVVEVGSPLQRSLAGRVQLADSMANQGWLSTPQEYLTVVETGQFEPLVSSMDAQLNSIADENQRLQENGKTADQLLSALEMVTDPGAIQQILGYLQQIGVVCLDAIDNHILHIRRHTSLLDCSEVRMVRGIVVPVTAHIQQHFDAMMNPMIQQKQILLGYVTGQQLQEFMMAMQMGLPAPAPGGGGPPPGQVPAQMDGNPPPEGTPLPMGETGQQPRAPSISKKDTQSVIGANLQ